MSIQELQTECYKIFSYDTYHVKIQNSCVHIHLNIKTAYAVKKLTLKHHILAQF